MHTFTITHDPALGGSGFVADYEYQEQPKATRRRDVYRFADIATGIGLLYVSNQFGPTHPDQRVALLKSMMEVLGQEPSEELLEVARNFFESIRSGNQHGADHE